MVLDGLIELKDIVSKNHGSCENEVGHLSVDRRGTKLSFLGGERDRPVIIIAAARSGTKMLRAALASSPDLMEFPYDINYIWKYGNYHISHDELTKADLTDEIAKFIRKRFRNLQKKGDGKRVLEKTVSNSLRVDFVKEVFPDCQIIHLYRDGRDVSVSARECWKASMFSRKIQPSSNLFKKIIQFPIAAAWPYLFNYLSDYASRFVNRNEHVKSWGPRFKGIDEFSKKNSLLKVCAVQWARSVELSLKSLSYLKVNYDYVNLRYEDLVTDPVKELGKIAEFLRIKHFEPVKEYARKKIEDSYVGCWRKRLSQEEIEGLLPHVWKYLQILGYD